MFLAWTTSDLAEEREKLRRELEARNYIVLPTGAPPLDAAGVRERIITALRERKGRHLPHRRPLRLRARG